MLLLLLMFGRNSMKPVGSENGGWGSSDTLHCGTTLQLVVILRLRRVLLKPFEAWVDSASHACPTHQTVWHSDLGRKLRETHCAVPTATSATSTVYKLCATPPDHNGLPNGHHHRPIPLSFEAAKLGREVDFQSDPVNQLSPSSPAIIHLAWRP
jgi:hypothetical protein